MGERDNFRFHDRCEDLKLNHLMFVDDVLLFCHGDFVSVQLMLQWLELFSQTSGLYPNPAKTAFFFFFFCAGMKEAEIQRILEMSSFVRGTLPFIYKGVLIYPRRMPAREGRILLDKMTSRIRMWKVKNLTYAGRVILINAVLMSIHSYWAQIMPLPKKMLK